MRGILSRCQSLQDRGRYVRRHHGVLTEALGLDRSRLRGLDQVNGEWALMATIHNILKLCQASLATTCGPGPPKL